MKFKELRLQANLLQQDVANKLGVDRSTVAKWETGGAMPRVDKLKDIAKLYGCTIDELLGV
jgi:transcriptional regulator with XRE-family HTH domain